MSDQIGKPRRGRPPGSLNACPACGELGHRRETCPETGGGRAVEAAQLAADEHVTLAQAARRVGISSEYARLGWRQLFGDRPAPARARSAAIGHRVVMEAMAGRSAAEIAKAVGCCLRTVKVTLAKRGLRARDPRRRLDLAAVESALDAVRSGAVVADAAADHGLTQSVLAREMQRAGVQAPLGMGPVERRDGRIARAVARIDAGETVGAACMAERCANPAVYAALARRRARS